MVVKVLLVYTGVHLKRLCTSEGDEGITSDYYAFLNGLYTFNNPEAVNINVFATPGLDLRDQTGLIENASLIWLNR